MGKKWCSRKVRSLDDYTPFRALTPAWLLMCTLLMSCLPQGGISIIKIGPEATFAEGSCGNVGALASQGDALYLGRAEDFDGGGIAKSIDNGKTWTWIDNELGEQRIYAILPLTNEALLAGTGDSSQSGTPFKTDDGGKHWRETRFPTELVAGVYTFAVDSSGRIYAGTNTGVFISEDQGETWQSRSTGLQPPDTRALTTSDNRIYAGTKGGGVFVTSDAGETWEAFNQGIEESEVFALLINNDQNSSGLYAGTALNGLWRRETDGSEWHRITNGLAPAIVYGVYAIVRDHQSGDLFIGTNGAGVFVSRNGGETWSPFGQELSDARVSALLIGDYADETMLYAGIWEGAVCGEHPLIQQLGSWLTRVYSRSTMLGLTPSQLSQALSRICFILLLPYRIPAKD